MQSGATGFVRGVGAGFAGLGTSAAGGLATFASKTTQGVSSGIAHVNQQYRFRDVNVPPHRLPRAIHRDGVLRRYDPIRARGQFVMWHSVQKQKYMLAGSIFVEHWELPHQMDDAGARHCMLLLTTTAMMMVREPKDPAKGVYRLKWMVNLSEINEFQDDPVSFQGPDNRVLQLTRLHVKYGANNGKMQSFLCRVEQVKPIKNKCGKLMLEDGHGTI